jgi:hypothetical protein
MEIIRGRENTIALSMQAFQEKETGLIYAVIKLVLYARLKEKDKKHTMRVVSLL